jgi:hypothetical protein
VFADAELRLKSLPGSSQDGRGNNIFLLRQSIGTQITNEYLLSAHTAHDDNGLQMDPLAPSTNAFICARVTEIGIDFRIAYLYDYNTTQLLFSISITNTPGKPYLLLLPPDQTSCLCSFVLLIVPALTTHNDLIKYSNCRAHYTKNQACESIAIFCNVSINTLYSK